MDLPSCVHIGHMTYHVVSDSDSWDAAQASGELPPHLVGKANHATLTIHVFPGLEPQQKADTLLHEIFHCAWNHLILEDLRYLRDGVDVQEHVVGRLTPLFMQIMMNNPDVLKYISDSQ